MDDNMLVVVIGLVVVFIGLAILIVAINIMNAVMSIANKKSKQEETTVESSENSFVETAVCEIEHDTLVVVLAAAIAAATNTDAAGIRIKSIKKA